MTDVIVDRLTEYSQEDARQLGELMPFLSDKFDGSPVDERLLSEIIDSPHHDQLVARLEGRIVGAATLSLIMGAAAGKKGYLEDFVTNPEVRGQGTGAKVWDGMMTWCVEQAINLEFTSHAKREAAHNLYHSRGAVVRETTVFHVDVSGHDQ